MSKYINIISTAFPWREKSQSR